MPTGYTAKLMEDGESFESFVLGCSRAFGALVMMRDDPMDAPIPEKFKPSDYYQKALTEANATVRRLEAMTDAEKASYHEAERIAAITRHREYIAKERDQNARLDEMTAKVSRWTPPSPDHAEMKSFMLEQLRISKTTSNWSMQELRSALEAEPLFYYKVALDAARKQIGYATIEHQKEVDRAEQRTRWVRQLRESLRP